MGQERSPGKPTTRRYSEAEKERAVRAVRQLRKELGTDHGTIGRVAEQLGFGTESLRSWVRQAEIDDGVKAGVSSAESARMRELEQEVRELRRELGSEHGTVQRVADQLGYGVETVRKWVKRADVDEGVKPGRSSEDAARMKALEQENRELKRANEILRKASAYFAQAELDRPWK